MRFYYVDSDYVKYLRQFENKISTLDYGANKNEKFICGVLLTVNNCDYYAPISSNKQLFKTSFPIYDKDNLLSTVRLSYMFPVPKSLLTEVNFKEIKKTNLGYYSLIRKEWNYILHNQEQLIKQAEKVYKIGTSKNHFLKKNCCDFILLEEKCQQYTLK